MAGGDVERSPLLDDNAGAVPDEAGAADVSTKKSRRCLWITLSLVGLIVLAGIGAAIGIAVMRSKRGSVIFLISDGFGPASQTFARQYARHLDPSKPVGYQLPLDTILVGSSRTRSSDSLVTDSAAGATAFSCVQKSYNGAVGVDENGKPCGTLLEAAKAGGYHTGVVTTSRITHATPGSFTAHVVDRDMEDEIAVQQVGGTPLGLTADLLMGGGRQHYSPSTRPDGRNVVNEAQERGYKYITSRPSLFDTPATADSLPMLGLFADSHITYEIDRDPEGKEPSLLEMVNWALDALTDASGSKPFFLMIEGARIDHAAHDNDPAAHYYEIEMYNRVIDRVKQYVRDHPGTVLISTSDHETGGFSLARQVTPEYPEYRWLPDVLERVKHSTYHVAKLLEADEAANPTDDAALRAAIQATLSSTMGINDPTTSELDTLVSLLRSDSYDRQLVLDELGLMESVRVELGWSTHGHSAVDVNLYAFSGEDDHRDRIAPLRGNHENTEVGQFIADYLELDLAPITEKLNAEGAFVTRMASRDLADKVVDPFEVHAGHVRRH